MGRVGQMLYIRVGDRPEMAVGTVKSVADVPRILRAVAERWEQGLLPDELDPPHRDR